MHPVEFAQQRSAKARHLMTECRLCEARRQRGAAGVPRCAHAERGPINGHRGRVVWETALANWQFRSIASEAISVHFWKHHEAAQ